MDKAPNVRRSLGQNESGDQLFAVLPKGVMGSTAAPPTILRFDHVPHVWVYETHDYFDENPLRH
jgi:hypothetical protein